MTGRLQAPGKLHVLVRQQRLADSSAVATEAAERQQRRHMHNHVGAIRFQAGRERCGAVFALAFTLDDRQGAAQMRRPPHRQRRFPTRHDASTDQCRWRVGFGDRLQDALDPVGRGDGIIVDIGDVAAASGRRAGVAGEADTGALHAQQLRIGDAGDQTCNLRGCIATGCAVHHQNIEPSGSDRLAGQPVQTVSQIVRAVTRADTDGDVHAPKNRRRGVEEGLAMLSASGAAVESERYAA